MSKFFSKIFKKTKQSGFFCFLIFSVSIIYMELIFKYCTTSKFFNLGLVFMPLFSIFTGVILSIICTSFNEKTNKILAKILLLFSALVFSVQIVYHWCFDKYLILYSLGAGGAGQVIEKGIWETTLKTVKACALPVILTFIPAILGCIFIGKGKLIFKKTNYKPRLLALGSAILYRLLIFGLVLLIPSTSEIMLQSFDPNLTASTFGLLDTEVMDLQYNILGINQLMGINSSSVQAETSSETEKNNEQKQYEPQKMDIDFKSLINSENEDEDLKELHKYISEREVTYKNEYTGMFEGYNLIFITAEGFSPYAIDPKLTPTLYKMQNSGFKFNNYYTPIWGVSTSDGEYANCTGLIPKSGVWSFYKSGKNKNNMAFTMGRQFLKSGVETVYAYHPHSYQYYHRDISHPNMGYKYTGFGNGLETKITNCWPESDLEMIEATADEYITSDKTFHTYYMSVSGHMEYSFTGNSMSAKNKKAVQNLNCSEAVKAYIACNIELDKAMESLLNKLEAAGVAEKTLIVIAPDHYPYGLEDKESDDKYHYFSEMLGHNVETNFELYKSTLIMYSPSMTKSVEINKYCSSLDIIPTLSNLFNFEYDSRLLMGKDIFSNSEQLVVFSNRSFITEKGMYNSVTKNFTPFKGVTLENTEEYVAEFKKEVNNMFLASAKILDYDYYGIVFGTKNTK